MNDIFPNVRTPPTILENKRFGMQNSNESFAPSSKHPRGHKPATFASSMNGPKSSGVVTRGEKAEKVPIIAGSTFKSKIEEMRPNHLNELPGSSNNSGNSTSKAAIKRSVTDGKLEISFKPKENRTTGDLFDHKNPVAKTFDHQQRRSSNQTNSMTTIASSQRNPMLGKFVSYKSSQQSKNGEGAIPSAKNVIVTKASKKNNEIVDLLDDDPAEQRLNPDGHRFTNMPISESLNIPLKDIWFGLLHIPKKKLSYSITIDVDKQYLAFNVSSTFDSEFLPFHQVSSIHFEPPYNGSDGFFAFNPHDDSIFQCVSCGTKCVLDPKAQKPAYQKYITIQVSPADWELLKDKLFKGFPKGTLSKSTTIHEWKSKRLHYTEEKMKALIEKDKLEKEYRQSLRSRRNTIETNQRRAEYTRPEDNITYLIYPIDPEAPDAVTISNGDLNRLANGVYFNDNLIDFMIKHLLFTLESRDEARRKKIYAFSCLFYAKLTEVKDGKKAHQLVSKWTKNVNLFDMEYTLFPVNLNNHWSLVVLMRPDMLKASDCDEADEEEERSVTDVENINAEKVLVDPDTLPDRPMFLHLDSLSMHPTAKICANLASYIWYERKTRLNYPPDPPAVIPTATSSPASDRQGSNNEAPHEEEMAAEDNKIMDLVGEDNAEVIVPVGNVAESANAAAPSSSSAKKGKDTPGSGSKGKPKKEKVPSSPAELFVKKLPPVKCQVPRQENGYDCGVFVIRFADMIINKIPRTHSMAVKEKFKSQFFKEFHQEDIDGYRAHIRSILEGLQPEWKIARDKWLEKCKEEGIFIDDDEEVSAISPQKTCPPSIGADVDGKTGDDGEEWLPPEKQSKVDPPSSGSRALKRQGSVIGKRLHGSDESEQLFDVAFASHTNAPSPEPVNGDEMEVDDHVPLEQESSSHELHEQPHEVVSNTAMDVDEDEASRSLAREVENKDLPESKRRRGVADLLNRNK